MPARSTISHSSKYRRPRVRGVVNRPDVSSEKGDVEEEWSDDSDSQESNLYDHRASPFNSSSYDDNFNELQNSMVKRVKFQTPPDYAPYTPNAEYGRYNSARASRGPSNTSSNSPSGQAVPYEPYHPTANSFAPYRGQQYDPSPQYHSPYPQSIPLPPQSYPSADPEVENIRKELEDMKMQSREKERRRLEKQREEENRRKKKKKAELQQKRKAKEQEEAQKVAFELKIQEMKADYEKRLLEIELKAARPRDQTADLYDILSKFLALQPAAGHYGHGYGCNAQGKQAHDISAIMRRLDSVAAPEWQAPPNRWFDGQGPFTRYHNDRHLIDDLRNQIDDLKQHNYNYKQIIGTLLPQQERWAGQLADGEYHQPHGPSHPMPQPPYPPWTSSNSNQPDPPELMRLPRKAHAGGPCGQGPSYPTAFFSGVEEPVETVESQRRNRNFRRYAGDEDSASAAVASHFIDKNQQTAENMPTKMPKQQPLPHEGPRANKSNIATRVATYNVNSLATRRIDHDEEEDGGDSDQSSDASDEVEERKHRPTLYVFKPDARFGREKFQARERHPQPFDQLTYSAEDHAFLAPSPPLTANEDFEVLPR
ncbi:hypothetical protein F4860DRAFT_383674 [Xylaria cubensis]|nr:hypothetical protein F4860DRAFT_383674 [Xylaria cubensis]